MAKVEFFISWFFNCIVLKRKESLFAYELQTHFGRKMYLIKQKEIILNKTDFKLLFIWNVTFCIPTSYKYFKLNWFIYLINYSLFSPGICLNDDDLAVSLGTSDTLMKWTSSPSFLRGGHLLLSPIPSQQYLAMIWYTFAIFLCNKCVLHSNCICMHIFLFKCIFYICMLCFGK